MSEAASDLRRILSSSGIYALAGASQQALSFLLLPIYTRFIDPADYGVLELLTAVSTLLFGALGLGLPSAVVKCYHRDCESEAEQATVLGTGLSLAAPALLLGGAMAFAFAEPIARGVLGVGTGAEFVRLVAATGVLTSLGAIVLATLRAQERAVAFSVISLTQVGSALLINLVLVVGFGLGVRGIFWGNLVSNAIALPIGLLAARRSARFVFTRRLARPLLHFGLLLVPVTLAGWAVNMSDRWVLRLFSDLSEVAVYGVGYKFAMVIEIVVVWPFQLAWPAISFSISNRPDHRATYARTLTYLTVLLAFVFLAVSFGTRIALDGILGEGYGGAYRVVPLVALAYALSGVQYCISPGLHLADKTRYLTYITVATAVLNLALNFLLIPRWGMMGAAWATAVSFLLALVCTGAATQRFYPVRYERRRLAKVVGCAAIVFFVGMQVAPECSLPSVLLHLVAAALAFPLSLIALGFADEDERRALRGLWQRYAPRLVR